MLVYIIYTNIPCKNWNRYAIIHVINLRSIWCWYIYWYNIARNASYCNSNWKFLMGREIVYFLTFSYCHGFVLHSQNVLDYMTTLGFSQRYYTVSLSFPRQCLQQQREATLGEMGFSKKVILNVEETEWLCSCWNMNSIFIDCDINSYLFHWSIGCWYFYY